MQSPILINRRFLELAAMLDLETSYPHASGIWLDYHSKLLPALQQTLMVSNSVGRTVILDSAIQLVAQRAARGTVFNLSAAEYTPAPLPGTPAPCSCLP